MIEGFTSYAIVDNRDPKVNSVNHSVSVNPFDNNNNFYLLDNSNSDFDCSCNGNKNVAKIDTNESCSINLVDRNNNNDSVQCGSSSSILNKLKN